MSQSRVVDVIANTVLQREIMALLIGVCALFSISRAAAAPIDELLAVDRAFAEQSAQEGPQRAFAAYLAEDSMQLPAGAFPLMGMAAILAGFDGLPEGFQLLWQPQSGEVAQSGELGWTWGVYQARYMLAGEQKESHGKYLNIWRQQAGVWKLVVDMGNMSPAAWTEAK